IGTISPLTWSSTLGNPDISSTFVSNFMEVFPTLVDGAITLVPVDSGFLRGDVSGDGSVNALLDTLFLLEWTFSVGADPPCLDAADINDDGEVNALVDGLQLLAWGFNSGSAPPAPGPDACGDDETGDAVDCAAILACG
ncbi:MAG: hypothetical protein L0Z55_00545, partial [Planctomycetes bacterium]|nr:hypothetical protein [Planctomycetota bacterium]